MNKEQLHLSPSIVILAGLPLSGKTEIGRAIARSTDALFFDIDETRQEISPGSDWLGAEKEKEIMLAAYRRNHEKAAEALGLGRAVVLAATYSRQVYHDMVQKVAVETGVPLYFFVLKLSEDEVERRIETRRQNGGDSNITDMQSYAEVRDRYSQPPNSQILDGALSINENVQNIITKLNGANSGH